MFHGSQHPALLHDPTLTWYWFSSQHHPTPSLTCLQYLPHTSTIVTLNTFSANYPLCPLPPPFTLTPKRPFSPYTPDILPIKWLLDTDLASSLPLCSQLHVLPATSNTPKIFMPNAFSVKSQFSDLPSAPHLTP